MEGNRNHPIVICSESRAAFMALDGFLITSKEVLKCRELLQELADNNLVNLLLVPGHANIRGNEKANRVGMPSCHLENTEKNLIPKSTQT